MMHTIKFPDKKVISFASCIEELSPADFLYLLKLLSRNQAKEITADEFRHLLLVRLLRIRRTLRYHRMTEQEKEIIHDQLNTLLQLLDSFYLPEIRDGKEVMSLKLEFIRNMIPRVGRYYGPNDALQNVSFYEYKEAFNQLHEYNEIHDRDSLVRMAAILYRPRRRLLWIRRILPRFDGHQRILYTSKSNPRLLEKRVKYFSRVPDHMLTGIYLWMNSCVQFLRSGKVVIDGHEVDFSVLYEGSSSGKPSIGLSGLLFSLSENRVFGDLFDTANTNIYDVMARLYQLKIDYDNQLENMKKK